MSWTYTGNPASSAKDAVRFTIADTLVENSYVTDEEIAWALAQSGNNVPSASAIIARALSAQFSTLSDEEIGPLKFKYAERAKNYEKIATRLESQSTSSQVNLSGIYGGGINVADKLQNEQDSSLVQPRLFRDQFKPVNVVDVDTRNSE
jgi:hypothetical protein